MTTAEATVETVGIERHVSTAYRLLWAAVIFDLLAFGIGFALDRRWHATHPFEDFFSPPHLFVYSCHLVATLVLAYITFTPDLRRHFGPAFRLWPFPFPVPGAIAMAGGGFVVTALAGMFDAVWHTSFGLDETAWSFPHSLLGWGIFVAFVGITACRVAISGERPLEWWSTAVFGFLLIATSLDRIPGPFLRNINIAELEFIRRIPVLAAEPAFQHTIRIYEQWDITRMSPLFLPLAAAGAGLGLGLLRRFDPRPLVVLALTAFLTYQHTLVPYVVPGAVIAAAGPSPSGPVTWRWWAVAGLCFGVAGAIETVAAARRTADFPLASALLAAPLLLAGAWLAGRIWSVVEAPRRDAVLAFVVIAGIGAPAVTGALDLYLRTHTP